MAKNNLKTDFQTLQNCLIEIAEIPARLNRCDTILKYELIDHINTRINSLLKFINERLSFDKNYEYPNEYLPNKKFQFWAERVSTVFNYYELLRLKESILNSIEKESNKDTATSGNFIFLDNNELNSEDFFKFLVSKWLEIEPNKKTALKCIVNNLWHKNQNKIPFKIISSINDFAIYWNENYNSLFEVNIKNPKLNEFTDTKDEYYQTKFDYYLHEFVEV